MSCPAAGQALQYPMPELRTIGARINRQRDCVRIIFPIRLSGLIASSSTGILAFPLALDPNFAESGKDKYQANGTEPLFLSSTILNNTQPQT